MRTINQKSLNADNYNFSENNMLGFDIRRKNIDSQFREDIKLLNKYIKLASENDKKVLLGAMKRLLDIYISNKIDKELISIITRPYG